jgi:SulP family sulfate permease
MTDFLIRVSEWVLPIFIFATIANVGLTHNMRKILGYRHEWRFAAPTAALLILEWHSVRKVGDVAPITGGFPPFSPPALALLDGDLVLAAATLALVVLIQGAGVSHTTVNLDGSPIDGNRDILAQGIANTATGLFSGIPGGGSVGQTALNIEVGGQTRWSGVFAGLWVLLFLLALPGVVSLVPMTVLAALMIIAGFSALDFKEARALLALDTKRRRTSWT